MTDTQSFQDTPPAGPGPRRRLVLVGHGMVGHRLVERLVERGATAAWTVTVLAEEPRPAYDRVHLTSLFDGTTAPQLSFDHEGRFCAEHGVDLRLGDPAVEIDRAARTVRTASGAVLGYDALVLATGSAPFVPPIPGRDAAGCFVYRTIEDVEAITEYAAGCQVGAVVGGGLLGLEAAGALSRLGLRTHVVEFAPRLMAVQVDDAGGRALRNRIEQLDITVHTGTRTDEVLLDESGAARGMRMLRLGTGPETPDEEVTLDAPIIVFAAGIRARDQLARDCGLPVGARGGVVVDEWCRTEDPDIYAVGECAQAVDGRVYGLVAPGYRMAETVADLLAAPDQAEAFTGADTSTKLKLLGVDVASFGDAFAATPGAHTAVFHDTSANVFKKLVITGEGHLLGGILVGDADAYDQLRPYSGAGLPLPAPAERYLLPAGSGDAPPSGPDALPDSANICSCHNVAKGRIRAAILDQGATDLAAIKSCTKAGTGCGSCVPLLTKILEGELTAAGIEVDHGICPHFAHTRAELAEIVLAKRIPTFARLLREHGRPGGDLRDGCEVCKPAVASILASYAGLLGTEAHVLAGEQASLQDTNDHFLANLQKNGSYSVVPRIPGGEITAASLIVIGEVARDFGLYTKITGGQRIDLFGARVEQLPLIWRRLVDAGFESGHAYGKSLRTVKSCVGSAWCRYGVQDSSSLAVELELRYRGLRSPHKLKSAVSGCARECAEAQSKDFGIIATELGWNLYVGGNGGYRPRHADLLAENLDRDRLIQVIDRFLMFYVRTADRLERTAPWLERLDGGLDHLRAVVLEDSLGIAADLEAAMAAHITSYRDEWAAVLGDPEKLSRFVSFVNAPEAPDPSIAFEVEREQIKPLMQIGRREEPVHS
ncbi:MAG TPA: nitrite reductase large subunit NirB [Actinocrinis sp.]|nr:nitrite reductase large subunit NirB [Actinocrinis sp.]